jgi:hypothetical protein
MGELRGAPSRVQSKASLSECRAGDERGIPGLERALRDARLDLPGCNAVPATATAPDKNCGPETWSTDQMMYVGVPCQNASTYEK